MLSVEQWQQIRFLSAQGVSARSIARRLNISRNTVRNALKADGLPSYRRSSPRAEELALWQESARQGLRRGLLGSRLLREARKAGYTASDATFYRFVAAQREGLRTPDPVCRFETDPGEQAQFDWSDYAVVLGGLPQKLHVFSLLLGYSRRHHFFPSFSVNQEATFEALEESFRHFGGVCRFLLVDNAKVFVDRHCVGDVAFNDNFLALCGHYSIHPIASTPAKPRGKGKVENPFYHLETLFLQGSEWRDFEHFQEELGRFEREWEERVHGTTKVSPLKRFEEERLLLRELPRRPFVLPCQSLRQVSNDCLISYGGVRYSVPWQYAGKSVVVRLHQGREVRVCALDGATIACHNRRPSGTPPVICQEHYEGLRSPQIANLHTLCARFRGQYAIVSQNAETFLDRLLGAHPHRPERALGRVMEMLSTVPDAVALAAIAEAVEFNLCTLQFLRQALSRLSAKSAGEGGPSVTQPPDVPNCPQLPKLNVERPLCAYGRAIPPRQSSTDPASSTDPTSSADPTSSTPQKGANENV